MVRFSEPNAGVHAATIESGAAKSRCVASATAGRADQLSRWAQGDADLCGTWSADARLSVKMAIGDYRRLPTEWAGTGRDGAFHQLPAGGHRRATPISRRGMSGAARTGGGVASTMGGARVEW